MLVLFTLVVGGCSGKDYKYYADAIKEQQVTQQLLQAQQANIAADRQNKHQLRMTELMGQMAKAASASPDKTDDMMVPLLFMIMEDKFQMAEINRQNSAPAQQNFVMKAPETTGEIIRSSTGLILGLGGLGLGIIQSNNMTDIATAGINAAGVHNTVSGDGSSLQSDSFKSGTDNVINGNENAISAGDATNSGSNNQGDDNSGDDGGALCSSQPGYFVDAAGAEWVATGVSCQSWLDSI